MFQISIATPDGNQKVDFNKDCFRFGNKVEIPIPVPEEHCATVYRRNSKIHFSNRSPQAIKLGRQSVNPGESTEWKAGKTAELGNGVTMQLLVATQNEQSISEVLSLEKVKQAVAFKDREGQLVDDKVIAMLCAGLLFYALTLL